MLKSMSLQPTEFFLRRAVDTPPSLFVLSELPCSVLQGSAEAGERLLHRTPTERIDSTGLLMSYTVQYRTSLQRKSLCKVKANKGLSFTFPGRYLSCGSDHVCSSWSPELSWELSSPAAFQFFLLFFFEFGPESESLLDSCFRFLRLRVRLSLSSSSLLSPELLSSSLPLVFAVFLFLCRLLVLFLLCLSLVALLSSLLLEHSAFLRFSSSSFFFFFFFLEDFLERFDKLASVSDLAFFILWRPIFFLELPFSLKKKKTLNKLTENYSKHP